MESVAAPSVNDLVTRILAADGESEQRQALEAGEASWSERARVLWDAVTEGRFASPSRPGVYEAHVALLGDERLCESVGGFTHAHALHGLRTVDFEADRVMGRVLVDMIATLRADPLDEVLAPFMRGMFLEEFARIRLMHGNADEELYRRPLFPQPQFDQACRRQVLEAEYVRFASIRELFPPDDPAFESAVVRYQGPGMLGEPLALVQERGRETEVLAAALAVLEDSAEDQDPWRPGACVLATVLSQTLGQPVPRRVFAVLETIHEPPIRSADDRRRFEATLALLPVEERESLTRLIAPEPPVDPSP